MTDSELAEKLNHYGVYCQNNKYFLAANLAFNQASQLKPKSSEIWSNLGSSHWNLCDFEKALTALHKSIELNPDSSIARGNLALVYSSLNMFDDALKQFDKAIAIDPDATGPQWDRMITKLTMGNWQEGLEEYEIRFQHKAKEYVPMPFPMWNGESLDNKTLFIKTEQGIGDCIAFSRYLPMIKEKWPSCKILILTDHELQSIFWPFKLKKIVDDLIPLGVAHPEADYGVYIMSLAKLFKTTTDNIPADPGIFLDYYSRFKPRKNIKLVRNTPKIGLCWAGNNTHALDHWRSIPFEIMAQLLDNSEFTFFSFQAGEHEKDIEKTNLDQMIFDMAPKIRKSWTETATFLLNMDLVITVDTAIAHLAGALNVPVWNLLYYAGYWQWLRGTETTRFYPSMRLIRQKSPGDWQSVINQVKQELLEFKVKDFIYVA